MNMIIQSKETARVSNSKAQQIVKPDLFTGGTASQFVTRHYPVSDLHKTVTLYCSPLTHTRKGDYQILIQWQPAI